MNGIYYSLAALHGVGRFQLFLEITTYAAGVGGVEGVLGVGGVEGVLGVVGVGSLVGLVGCSWV